MILTKEQMAYVSGYRAAPAVPMPAAKSEPDIAALPSACKGRTTARSRLNIGRMSQQQREVFDVIVAACRNGVIDLTGREIKARYLTMNPGKEIETNSVRRCLNGLIDSHFLERCPRRFCTVTREWVEPVRPVAQQQRIGG
jgi:hypothetical protein